MRSFCARCSAISMSDDNVWFDVRPRDESFHGLVSPAECWTLKLFVVAVDGYSGESLAEVRKELSSMVASIEERLSSEFTYGRFGFAVIHFGRRGTCVSVTHFGSWGTTFEVYSSVWYRYAGASGGFTLLDDIEPAMCWFEVQRSTEEIRLAYELAMAGPLDHIRKQYLARI